MMVIFLAWGVAPDGMVGGLRMMSPVKMSQQDAFRSFEQTVEREFKLRMNIFSSTGGHPSLIEENNETEEENLSFFGNVPKIQKSLFGLDEFVKLDSSWIDGVADADPGLAYYVYYDEARNVVLSNNLAHENYSVVWLYNALLNQDAEVFNKVILKAKEVYASLPNNVKQKVAESFLVSITDGQQVNSSLGLKDSEEFTTTLQNSGLLEEIKPFMSKREIATYFPSGKKMKR